MTDQSTDQLHGAEPFLRR